MNFSQHFLDNNLLPLATGALLFAVCRGKVSEGLDFSDDNARAVIVVCKKNISLYHARLSIACILMILSSELNLTK